MTEMDTESYAHETISVALDALHGISISGSLGDARQLARDAISHLEGRRAAIIALSKRETSRE